MNIQKVFLKTEDKAELVGLLHTGEKTNKVVIAVHGMTSDCLKRRDDIIAKTMVANKIDYFTFNNRGHNVMSYLGKEMQGVYAKQKCGTAYEDIRDSYYDIKATMNEMLAMGYDEIYLQGHSLGCTKIVYAYNKMKTKNEAKYLNPLKAIILLSLVDIPRAQEVNLAGKYNYMLNYAVEKEKHGEQEQLMPEEAFIHPITVRTYLSYFKNNKHIDFARYNDPNYTYPELNNITVPLFMRWGTVFEMIEQPAEELVKMMNKKITNPNKDINSITGANHGYTDKEQDLADEILKFLVK